uniref:Uncharacterized protein n=1 Tax=Romanomermis culicivorax TaxID=13658 RepID=A0A915J561_ROMCU
MPKKFIGENTKAAEARARKTARNEKSINFGISPEYIKHPYQDKPYQFICYRPAQTFGYLPNRFGGCPAKQE